MKKIEMKKRKLERERKWMAVILRLIAFLALKFFFVFGLPDPRCCLVK